MSAPKRFTLHAAVCTPGAYKVHDRMQWNNMHRSILQLEALLSGWSYFFQINIPKVPDSLSWEGEHNAIDISGTSPDHIHTKKDKYKKKDIDGGNRE